MNYKIKKLISPFSVISATVFVLSIVVYFIGICNAEFADLFNFHISAFIRGTLASFTSVFNFSLAETIILMLPALAIFILIYVYKSSSLNLLLGFRNVINLFSFFLITLSVFILSFGVAYSSSSVGDRLLIPKKDVISPENLSRTALIVSAEIDKIINDVDFSNCSSSNMPYTVEKMDLLLQEACISASEKYSFYPKLKSRVKPIVLSELLTYTHISGIFTFYTGEANLNINFPDYCLPFTAAHELSHQRGIAPEDEANFMAFLVCLESDDVYIRYSGYANILEYLLIALSASDIDLYMETLRKIDDRVFYEYTAYSAFFEKYRDSIASKITGEVNDKYLKIQGEENGVQSYGLVVELAVGYFEKTEV